MTENKEYLIRKGSPLSVEAAFRHTHKQGGIGQAHWVAQLRVSTGPN